jgi:hypothetical protein
MQDYYEISGSKFTGHGSHPSILYVPEEVEIAEIRLTPRSTGDFTYLIDYLTEADVYVYSYEGIFENLVFQTIPIENIPGPDTLMLGDINNDEILDILDIVILVNIVLGYSEEVPQADVNEDGLINVLDVVILVNIILS